MILPNIPLEAQRKISSEIGVDLGFFSAKRSEERGTLDSDVSRVNAASKYILSAKQVGSLTQPGSWVYDTAEVSYFNFPGEPDVVFFAGDKGNTIFALGGSRYHIVGDCRGENSIHGMSFMPRLLEALKGQILHPDPDGDKDKTVAQYISMVVSSGPQSWIGPIRKMAGDTSVVKQKVEFLAKVLLNESVNWDSHIHLLATPLYISLAD
jgi:hypothetical protein